MYVHKNVTVLQNQVQSPVQKTAIATAQRNSTPL